MKIVLTNVRLSFPAIFTARAFNDDQEAKFSAVFLVPKTDKRLLADVTKAIDAIILEQWKGKKPSGLKICMRDGEEKSDVDGYGDEVMFLSASSKKRIPIVDRDRSPLGEEDGKIYGGCYVNASVKLWAQDNKWGKRVNAQLLAVQFVKDGAPFGEKPVDANEEFSVLEDSDIL